MKVDAAAISAILDAWDSEAPPPPMSHARGMDYIRFAVSPSPTGIQDEQGIYYTLIPAEAKTKVTDKQLQSTKYEMKTYWSSANQWGAHTPRIDLVVPVLDRADHPSFTLDQFNHLQPGWKITSETEDILRPRVYRVPFVFQPVKDVQGQAAVAVSPKGTKAHELSQLRTWVKNGGDAVIQALGRNKIVALVASVGAGKTSCMAYMSTKTNCFNFFIFERISLAQKMTDYDDDPTGGASPRYLIVNHADTPGGGIHANLHAYLQTARSNDGNPSGKGVCMCRKSLKNQLDMIEDFLHEFPLKNFYLFWDEAHLCQDEDLMKRLLKLPNLHLVLVTATLPRIWTFRDDRINEELSRMEVIKGIDMAEAIDLGYTMPPTFRFVDALEHGDAFDGCLDYLAHGSHSRNAIVLVPNEKDLARAKDFLLGMPDEIHKVHTCSSEDPRGMNAFKRDCLLDAGGKKNVLVAIYMCDVGVDFPHVDTVVYLRTLDNKTTASNSNIEAWQTLDQRMRQTRYEAGKTIAEFVLPNLDATRDVVGDWIAHRDPDLKFTECFKYSKVDVQDTISMESLLPNQCHSVMTYLKDRIVKCAHAKKDIKVNPYEYNLAVTAFLDAYGTMLVSTSGDTLKDRWFEITVLRGADTVSIALNASDYRTNIKKWYTKRVFLNEGVRRRIEGVPWLMYFVRKPHLQNVQKPKQPANYQELLSAMVEKEGERPFNINEFTIVYHRLRKKDNDNREINDWKSIDQETGDFTYKLNQTQRTLLGDANAQKTVTLDCAKHLKQYSNLYELHDEVAKKVKHDACSGQLKSCVSKMIFYQLYTVGKIKEEKLEEREKEKRRHEVRVKAHNAAFAEYLAALHRSKKKRKTPGDS